MDFTERYNSWLNSSYINDKIKDELRAIADQKEIEDRFYKDLEFGTGGLRGIIGAGTNRMNIYTVGKATQGLARYLLDNIKDTQPSVVVGHDSRIMSREFAETVALILCANGVKTFLFEDLRPTPLVSFAVRELNCQAGIMITASHNPKEYNGYKVYGSDGGQITDGLAKKIFDYIQQVTDLSQIQIMDMEQAENSDLLHIIGDEIDTVYTNKVKDLTIRKDIVREHAKELRIIYTPLHGTGNIPIRRALKELGYDQVYVVKEQEEPDGNFPTAPAPNPEDPKVFDIALKMAAEINPDLIIGTDPDSDRLGVVVKDNQGEYIALTGNQVGALLTNYILESLQATGKMPDNGTIIKTIVTTEMSRKIAADYNCSVLDVLTGFKYIGEKIKEFEETDQYKFIFGFEESYGYLLGEFVRDKDAVIASTVVCEMALYYKKKNTNLYNALLELYKKYGFYKEELISINLEGKEGTEKISKALEFLRDNELTQINGIPVTKILDYKLGIEKDLKNSTELTIDLPESNVLKFILEDQSWFVVRPSGTEPKMKIYLAVVGDSEADANEKLESFKSHIKALIDKACK